MTDTRRTRNASSPLGAGEAFDRLDAIRSTRGPRLHQALRDVEAAFNKTEQEQEEKLLARVPTEQRVKLEMMLSAVGKQPGPPEPEEPSALDTAIRSGTVSFDGANGAPDVPDRLLQPLSAERLAVGKR